MCVLQFIPYMEKADTLSIFRIILQTLEPLLYIRKFKGVDDRLHLYGRLGLSVFVEHVVDLVFLCFGLIFDMVPVVSGSRHSMSATTAWKI